MLSNSIKIYYKNKYLKLKLPYLQINFFLEEKGKMSEGLGTPYF